LPAAIYASFSRLDRQLRGERSEWTGSFNGVLYEVPERSRAYRDRLRRTAQLLGYVTLRSGLLISTTDRWDELLAVLEAPPPGTQLLRTGLTLGEEDSRRVAAELWDLEATGKRLEASLAEASERTDRAERRAATEGFTPREAFRAFAEATLRLYEAAANDPDLPDELLPPDWPGNRVGATIGRANRVFGPLIWPYMQEVQGAGESEKATRRTEAVRRTAGAPGDGKPGDAVSPGSSRTEAESQSRAPAGAR
ncbi:MAG: PaaX family transcriptional regulator C-terminal domain-containing protein, partial [Acidimicrobiales bacterium]